MNDIIMIKYGEIILKGLNRPQFEDRLLKNIKRKLYGLGEIRVVKYQAAVYVYPECEDYDYDTAVSRLKKVFGIIWITRAKRLEKSIEEIKKQALISLREVAHTGKTFKVEVKRPDKTFPYKSPELQQIIGDLLFVEFENTLSVDVKNPDIIVMVEIRPEGAYVYSKREKGPGGLPVGVSGKGALLLSGGIDSPVAGYMMAKRGMELMGVHFHSYPYTSERAKKKVTDLAEVLREYAGRFELYCVHFTDIQLMINEYAPHDMLVILMRRYMMRIAEALALKNNASALITGESLGQVASQTVYSIGVTNSVVHMPVLRPLIGMDKDEITSVSRKMEAFEISIRPYEDCCTVFVPKHPKTKPREDMAVEAERLLEEKGIGRLVEKAIEEAELTVVSRQTEE